MIASWRRKRSGRGADGGSKRKLSELIVPSHFRCPISLELMKDPVTLSTGITYDRDNIEKWIEAGNVTCPVTNQVLRTLEPIPNHTIRRMIQDWCVDNRSHGVERIPTPRIPISSDEVGTILERIEIARAPEECQELVGKMSKAMKESERNKRCILENGASKSLSLAFQTFADSEGETVISLLEEIMSVITTMTPLDTKAQGSLKTPKSLGRLVWFLRRGGLSSRRNAVLILKELVSSSKDQGKVVESLIAMEGTIEGLFKLVKEPICPTSTKASLVVIYNMITSSSSPSSSHLHASSSNKNILIGKFIEMGLMTLVLDILVDAEKSISEKALGVLDGLCRTKEGLKAAYDQALIVPVVVKKILRVSDLATEFSVSILCRLCENEEREDGGVIVEALQVGAFQKLLLILQVGWNINERIKEKVTKMLKLLNLYRSKVECIESMDFKDLKRPF